MDISEEQTSPAPRRRVGLRRIGMAVLLLLAAPIVAWVVWDRVEASRLSRRLDALFPFVDAGEQARDAARDRARTAEQQEASRLYAEAARLMRPSPTDDSGVRLQEAGKVIEALSSLPRGHVARDPRLQDLRRVEEPYDGALPLLDRATALDAAQEPEESDRARDVGSYQRVANINALRAARLAFAGQGDAAAAALMGTLRLGRILSTWWSTRVPFRTTATLEAILGSGSPSESMLRKLQSEYEATQPAHAVEDVLVSGRYQLARVVAPEEFGAPSQRRPTGPVQAVLNRLGRPVRDNRLVAELQAYDEAMEAAQQPWPAKLDAAQALAKKYRIPRPAGSGRHRLLENLFAPWGGAAVFNLMFTVPAVAESLARARVSIAALAIERHRGEHRGALPDTLAQLVPTYVATIPVDPFSGGELKYRPDANGYRVYSVGVNRQDDGGVWDQTSDLNPYRRGDPKDVGIAIRTISTARPR